VEIVKCDNHQYLGANVKGMYVFHKPTEHNAWKARKNELIKRCGKKFGSKDTQNTTPTSTPSVPSSTAPANASKLSLAKSLEEALTTTAKLSKDQFNKIWQNCCDALETEWPQM
jgi:hypothetical protein